MYRPYRIHLLDHVPQPLPPRTLACVVFGHAQKTDVVRDPRIFALPMPCLHGPCVQLWEATGDVHHGHAHGLDYARTGDVLMAIAQLPESRLTQMADASFDLYRRIDALLAEPGCASDLGERFALWRVWHFLAGITQGRSDEERYRQFSLGRHRAVATMPGFEHRLPAATAVGMADGGLRVLLLAGVGVPQQVENPRQVSAFHYPRDYGPRSPSFSRAVWLPWQDGEMAGELIASGTASIVGHQSRHAGALLDQWQEVQRNLASLQQQIPGTRPWALDYMTVYLRDGAAWPQLRTWLPAVDLARISLVEADICRTDLDIEAEALYRRC